MQNLNGLLFLSAIGIFLYGMALIEGSLSKLASGNLNKYLSLTSQNTLAAIATGAVTTAIVQSSSLIGLIVLAMASASILNLKQSIAIMIGANLGTTMTGWLAAFLGFKLNLGEFAIYIIGLSSFGVLFGSKKAHFRLLAKLILGIGLIFLGLEIIKDATIGLSQEFDLMQLNEKPLIVFLLVGIVLSAVIQSSSVVMIMTLSAINAEAINIQSAAALVIGADLGTTSTIILGSLRGANIKKQLALAAVSFNVITDLLTFFFLLPFMPNILNYFAISDPLISLVAFHSLFNLFGILALYPLITKFVVYVGNHFKEQPDSLESRLYSIPFEVTPVSLKNLHEESIRFLIQVKQINLDWLSFKDDHIESYLKVKHREGLFINFSQKLLQQRLDSAQSEVIYNILSTIRDSVYSTKSLKDISHDFEQHDIQEALRSSDKEHMYYLSQKFFTSVNELFTKQEDIAYKDFINTWQEEIQQSFDKSQNALLSTQLFGQTKIHRVSTLLNINKELFTSCKYYLSAINSLNSINKDMKK